MEGRIDEHGGIETKRKRRIGRKEEFLLVAAITTEIKSIEKTPAIDVATETTRYTVTTGINSIEEGEPMADMLKRLDQIQIKLDSGTEDREQLTKEVRQKTNASI